MISTLKSILILIAITIFFASCRYMSKKIRTTTIDIASFSQNEICNGGQLSEKVKQIFKPFMSKGLIFKPQGKIYQLAIEPVIFLEITDSNYNKLTKFRNKLMGEKDTYDATVANFEAMIEGINTDKICNSSITNSVADNLNAILAENSNSKVIVLSTSITDTIWNNFKVFNEVSKLTDYVVSLTNAEGSQKFLILIEPVQPSPQGEVDITNPQKLTDSNIVIPPKDPVSGTEGIRQALLNITKNSDPVKRRELANKLFIDSFTTQVYIKMYRENINSEPDKWDYNDGKNYILKRLTSEESIRDIIILKNPERSNTDNKISHIELIEIHKH